MIIDTYEVVGRTFQFRVKRGWDGLLYFETGKEWKFSTGFGHPMPGRHIWEAYPNGRIYQCIPGVMVFHYPIFLSKEILDELSRMV